MGVNLIEGTTVTISDNPARLSANEPNVIRAYTVRISGNNKAPSQPVTIYASEIIADPGSSIDSSGHDGNPNHVAGVQAAPGGPPGANGSKGEDGGPGSNGGDILIFCDVLKGALTLTARGGTGGRGQDGGDGAKGQHGPDGQSNAQSDRGRATGGAGGTGGNAGPAGLPGRSGNGGNITVNTIVPVAPGGLVADAKGGANVPAAMPGRRGDPGDPGQGKEYGSYIQNCHRGGDLCPDPRWASDGVAPNGPPAQAGNDAPPAQASPQGLDGTLKVNKIASSDLAKGQTTQVLAAILAAGERAYLNDRYNEALPYLVYVAAMAGVQKGGLP